MPTLEECEQKIIKLMGDRDVIDTEIVRVQTLKSRLSERDSRVSDMKRDIILFDISQKELFPPKARVTKEEVDDTAVAELPDS